MKCKSKSTGMGFKCLFFAGLFAVSLNSIGQRTAVMADPKLGAIELSDMAGYALDANSLQPDQLIKLRIPVAGESHGKSIPAGSCKIKIGLGSKLELDPQFDLNSAGLSSYFSWTSSVNSGQLQITGDLINALPADLKSVEVAFRVKGAIEGKSTITANFLITNHKTPVVLSDENGANNGAALAYRVTKKFDLVSSIPEGNLKLSVYPNPAKDVKSVMIKVAQGKLNGKYKVTLFDITGKQLRAKELQLNFAPNFTYELGNITPGQYLIKVLNTDGTESSVMKFEKF
ncbi:MAG: T9SS type A sorting domain-containing protein [Rhizobacter sp.]|nr:T9SS type A sorting domain-containing protein [Ferruginibacter sp.]